APQEPARCRGVDQAGNAGVRPDRTRDQRKPAPPTPHDREEARSSRGSAEVAAGRSDNATAEIAGVSDKTVAAMREDLEGRSEIPNVDTRTDTKGRQQPAAKPPRLPSKEAQIRALREQKPVVVRPPITDAVSTDAVDA